jgi:inorganic pyrophosphatase
MSKGGSFWDHLDLLVAESRIVIDPSRGSSHPYYPEIVYSADYGYLENTRSMDGGGIDVWIGSFSTKKLDAIICTVDLTKRDPEIKLLIGCSEEEKQAILRLLNTFPPMRGLLIRREES